LVAVFAVHDAVDIVFFLFRGHVTGWRVVVAERN
jgi:hypothetical protein